MGRESKPAVSIKLIEKRFIHIHLLLIIITIIKVRGLKSNSEHSTPIMSFYCFKIYIDLFALIWHLFMTPS